VLPAEIVAFTPFGTPFGLQFLGSLKLLLS